MALDPRQLRAFLAIVEAGSLGMAAESLHVTQPALSRMVKRLEDQLGVPLFERRTTGMELTTFGEALLPHATVLSAEGARALEQIRSEVAGLTLEATSIVVGKKLDADRDRELISEAIGSLDFSRLEDAR